MIEIVKEFFLEMTMKFSLRLFQYFFKQRTIYVKRFKHDIEHKPLYRAHDLYFAAAV